MKAEDCSVGVGGVCRMAGAALSPVGGVRGGLILVLRGARASFSRTATLGEAGVSKDKRSMEISEGSLSRELPAGSIWLDIEGWDSGSICVT